MSKITAMFAALDGAEIPGGCDLCDAYQTVRIDVHGITHFTVHHDDWCPFLRHFQRRRRGAK